MIQPTSYAFPTGTAAADQFDTLQTVLDPLSTARLTELRLPTGARCWEAGAGGGSIAHWLAAAVAPTGHVVATDTDTSRIAPADNLHIATHDLREDSVPDGGPFHLVHARLVLIHQPQRRAILDRLIAATAPRGWLVIEEFDCTGPLQVLHTTEPEDADLFDRYVQALYTVLQGHGADLGWAQQVHPLLTEAGLRRVHTVVHAESWTGGSAGCRLHYTNAAQLAGQLTAAGLSADELDRFGLLMRDPGFAAMSYPFVSSVGQVMRP